MWPWTPASNECSRGSVGLHLGALPPVITSDRIHCTKLYDARAFAAIAAAVVAVSAIGLSLGRPTVAAVDPAADVIAVSRPVERFYAAGHTHAVRVSEYQGDLIVQVDGALADRVPVRGSAPTHRITSYNVCYTKLLRSMMNFGVLADNLPQVIFSLGTAPE